MKQIADRRGGGDYTDLSVVRYNSSNTTGMIVLFISRFFWGRFITSCKRSFENA